MIATKVRTNLWAWPRATEPETARSEWLFIGGPGEPLV
jgi:hypothetical protein